MSNVYKIVFFVFCCTNIFAQQGSLLGIGATKVNIDMKSDVLSDLDITSYEAIYLSYQWSPSDEYSAGLELHKSIVDNIDITSIRLKFGVVLNGKQRIQFPVYPFVGLNYISRKEKENYSGFSFGASIGPRIYITDNLAIEGGYSLSWTPITMIDGDSFNKPQGTITEGGIFLGLRYYLSNK